MADVPQWRLSGDWFDVCNCTIPCPCYFAQAPAFGDCEGTLVWHIGEGRYGQVVLDGLNVLGLGAFTGNRRSPAPPPPLHPHHAELATAMGNICRAGNHPPPGMLRDGPAARAHPRIRVRRHQPHRPAAAGFLIALCDLCAIKREQPRRHILTHVPVALR
jgi:Protein of unknown function (DUF1326)